MFIDASKAFDLVNHWTLFTKLIYSGISLLIVRILVFWYQTQQLCIKWGGSTSRFFTISSGVRQGGILCPKIFTTAMQNLIDISHNYGAANDILFNPLKSVWVVYKPIYYKLFCPSVNIGSEPLRLVNKTK